MNERETKILGDAFANILVSHAAHGLATSSLHGVGEITLRDGLIVAAASIAAELRQGWLLVREVRPDGWQDSDVDLLIFRKGNAGVIHILAGVELKWWRREDAGNAANRRKDLIKDFFRGAALYSIVEEIAFVALVSTAFSWKATASTKGSDQVAMGMLGERGSQVWNTEIMVASNSVRSAMRELVGKVPVSNIFNTKLISDVAITEENERIAFAKVWSVKKPQNSRWLNDEEIEERVFGWP
jgi:hypothetical protein